MSTQHVHDLLPLFALGALEPDEAALVKAHLPQCANCRADADDLLLLAGALSTAATARQPDPRLRADLLNRVKREGRRPSILPLPLPAAAPRPQRPPPPAAPRRRAPSWSMAAMLAGLASLLLWNVYLTSRVNTLQREYRAQAAAVALISSPITESTALAGVGRQGRASGRAYIDPTSRSVVLIVEHLEPLEENQTYQAWVITEAGPQSAGLLSVSRSGWGMSWLSQPYPAGAVIGVSVEPAGGSATPTEVVLLQQG